MYTYCIVYQAELLLQGGMAWGNMECSLDHPINSMNDIREIAKAIAENDRDLRKVVIMNWLLLSSE